MARYILDHDCQMSLFMNRLWGKEGDLPVILKANNEEIRVLKIKMKQVRRILCNILNLLMVEKAQESNKKLSNRLKEKNSQVIDLQEDSKEFKRRNKDDGHDNKYDLREQLEEVTRNLKERDTEFKVTIDLLDINYSPAQYYRAYCTARMS